MAVHEARFPDGTQYPQIPAGTNVVNVSDEDDLYDALDTATAGDRIVLASGTYSGDFTMSGRSGSSSAGITVEAASPGGAEFSSGSTWRVKDCAYVTFSGFLFDWDGEGEIFQFRGDSHHCRLTRSTFGPSSRSESSDSLTWIYVGDVCHDIRIDHNEIRNKGTSGNGVRVYGDFDSYEGCKRVRIDHNLFDNIGPEVGNDKEPVRYGVSTMSRTYTAGVIERNVFRDITCEPEVVSVKMAGIRVSGNTMLQCAGSMVIRHGTNSTLVDNYIIDRENTVASDGLESGGVRFYDADHTVSYNYIDGTIGEDYEDPLLLDTGDAEGDSSNLSGHWRVIGADVQRNVLVNTPRGVSIGDNYSSTPRDCTIRDNFVAGADSGAAITQRIAPSSTVIAGNVYHGSPSAGGMTRDVSGVWRKAGYGPRVSYIGPSGVGPSGDSDDSDGTGDESGGVVATPADVLNIGDDPTQNHFQLQYARDGSSGNDWSKVEFSEVAAGWASDPYFVVVGPEGSTQTLGVGGTPTASGPDVILFDEDDDSTLVITESGVYDGQGHTVGKIQIETDDVTVQNFHVRGSNNAGIYSGPADNVTIQNNDIAQVNEGGAGDINGITFFGNGVRILYNKIDNLVDGPLNGSHTDGIQCWATESKGSSSNVTIVGNWINGPDNDDERHIHQAIMAEGPDSTDGGGGASGTSQNWLVAGNYCNANGDNQCIKFDDIHDVVITRNTFPGSSDTLCETGSLSTGIDFYGDNVITGDYDDIGVTVIPGAGPGAPTVGGREHTAVQFQVRADAGTTSGTSYPRSELRETRSDGREMAFDAMAGTHELHTRARITYLPADDPEVIVAQLHDGVTADRISIRTQLISGRTKLLCRINGTQSDPRLSESYTVGDEVEIRIRVSTGGFVEVFYQGSSTPITTGQLVSTGGATWYWKLGAYAQFNENDVAATEYVSVEHRDLWVSHGGYRVDVGADITALAGQQIDRPAIETGLTGISSRRWMLISAPAPDPGDDGGGGDPGGSMDEAAYRHGWGAPLPESDEFNYKGAPDRNKWKLPGESWDGHNGNGRRRPDRQTVDGSKLVMTGLENGDSGWMEHLLGQQYGRWEARVRSYPGAPSAGEPDTSSNGNDYHPLLLLWPDSNSRQEDGEYDFMENFEPGASHLGAFIHYPHPGTEDVQQEYFETPCDMSQWNNIGMEWTSEHIKGYLNGQEWFSVSDGANDVRRNIQDMPSGHLCIQLDNFDGTNQSPATLEVDWLRVYSL